MRQEVIQTAIETYKKIVDETQNIPDYRDIDDKYALCTFIIQNPWNNKYINLACESTDMGEDGHVTTPDQIRQLADELAAIRAECPHLSENVKMYGDEGRMWVEWQASVRYPDEVINEAVLWVQQMLPLITKREVLFEAVIGKRDYGMSDDNRRAAAAELIAHCEKHNIHKLFSGAYQNIKQIIADGGDVLDSPHINKKKMYAFAAPGIGDAFREYVEDNRARPRIF